MSTPNTAAYSRQASMSSRGPRTSRGELEQSRSSIQTGTACGSWGRSRKVSDREGFSVRIEETVPVGELPPLGHVPPRMLAQVVRQSRYGDPRQSFQVEEIDTPRPGPGQVLIAVMAAGVNFNNVWAARGLPIDVIGQRMRAGAKEDFHVGGSDASGIVYEVGDEVTKVKVGDHVIVHPGYWDADDPWVRRGK